MISVRNRGFTLIEMLLSLAIFAMLGVATYSVLNTTISGKDHIESQTEQLTNIQRAMMFIENDLQQVVQRKIRLNGEPPVDKYFIAQPYLLDSEELGFAFIRDGWINPAMILPRSELQAVGYRVYEGKLQRLYFNFVDADTGEEPRIQNLIDGVSDLRLSYFYDNQWQDDLPDSGLPTLIKLTFVTEAFGDIERMFAFVEKTAKVTPIPSGANSANDDVDSSNDDDNNTKAER